ncbi:C39 family peptidase [Rubritalea marina]|uniref:C39 family peptidase n=1 Tax=Rubritalea marina TaxID=361055 RepID=UPI00037C5300|nr:C39 family peptidase [Rubritalea marina]
MNFKAALSLLTAMTLPLAASEWVEITQRSSGKSLKVIVLALEDGKITFETQKGKTFTTKSSALTDESIERAQQSLSSSEEGSEEQLQAINDAIGHQLFKSMQPLWKQDAGTVASRVSWPLESSSEQSSSYRYYPPKTYTFLGAHPYSAVLYGNSKENPTHLSLVFANKGDYGSRLGMGEDHFKKIHPNKEVPKSLEKAIQLDAQVITDALTEAIGTPKKQYFGEKEDKRRVLRWNFGSHAFILSEKKSEYTSLLIVPTSVADNQGKVAFVKDAELRSIVADNVERSDNGDTVIKNIPMVDQGPKGYCAPATFERAMRYMLVPADMYLLATVATDPEGGTNTMLLADSAKRIIRSKARRIKDLSLEKDLKMRKVKQFIDKGVPILWQMRSLKEYNDLANKRTSEREEIEDYAVWSQTISAEAEQIVDRLQTNDSNHHICLIIGYNEATNEIAVSDSWGPRYALRWVHIDIAQAVTSRGGFVIDL